MALGGAGSGADSVSYCVSTILTGVVALCLNERYPHRARSYWKTFGTSYYCTPATLPDYEETLANATLNLSEAPLTATKQASAPFLIPDVIFENWRATIYGYYNNVYLSQTYGWIMVVAICFVMATAASLRFLDRITRPMQPNRLLTAFQKYVTEPALFGGCHAHRPTFLGLHLSIPTRLESIFLLIYIVVNITLCFTQFHIFSEGNYYWPGTKAQYIRYLADRTGILAFGQFPLLFAFAGRNTIFLWLTGWSYQSFSVFHKWIGRVCVFQALLHAIMYTVDAIFDGGVAELKSDWVDAYFRWGVAAMVSGGFMASLSVYSIRALWYELFLVSHILLAIVWLMGSYYHVKLLKSPEYLPWVWTAMAFWAFDRATRLLRVLVINLFLKNSGDRLTEIEVMEDSVLRMTIPVPDAWKSSPGQYVFVYFPSFKFWQSHPFTIVNVTSSRESSVSRDSVQVNKAGISGISTTEVMHPSTTTAGAKEMTIVLRAHRGVTQKILQRAIAEGGGKLRTRALIEGPYGTSHDLSKYDKVVLVAAGLGITACLPFLMHLTTSTKTEGVVSNKRQEVVMHWIIQDESSIAWFSTDFERALHAASPSVKIIVHVTRESSKHKDKVKTEAWGGLAIETLSGRPIIQDLLKNEVQETKQASQLAVVSCGPGTVSDDCRQGVVQQLGHGRGIRYFEESFTW